MSTDKPTDKPRKKTTDKPKPRNREARRQALIEACWDNIIDGKDRAPGSMKILSDVEGYKKAEQEGLDNETAKRLANIAESFCSNNVQIEHDTFRAILSVLETHPTEELEQKSIFLDLLRHKAALQW